MRQDHLLLFITANGLQALGLGPVHTALGFVPLSLASVPTAAIAVTLTRRLGVRVPLIGALVMVAGIAVLLVAVGVAGAGLGASDLLPGLAVAGLGLGLVSPTLIDVVPRDVTESDTGAASGVLNTVLQLGSAIGIALVGLVYYGALSSTAPDRDSSAQVVAALDQGLRYVFAVAALTALAVALIPGPSPSPSLHGHTRRR